ncbi:S24 family peptidase [Thermincola ferriacetica]
MGISENLKKLREIYGLTQEELAKIAGVTNKAVSTWETGTKEPRMGAIERIANHFGLKKSNLIEDGGMDFLDNFQTLAEDDRMDKRAKILAELIEKKDYSRRAFAEKTGIPATTLQSILTRGIGRASIDNVIKICKELGITVEEMERLASGNSMIAETPGAYAVHSHLVMVPIVGSISCGNGLLAYEDIEGYEPTPKEWLTGGEHFYLRAKGDSMVGARIYEGDLLLIRKQSTVDDGEIAAVLIDDTNEAVLKRVYRSGDKLILQSENPKYAPILAPPAEVKIIGKLRMNVIKY